MIYQLAPMESVSAWAFRVLCSKLGADRTYVEMLRAKALGKHNKASWDTVDTYGEEHCHMQLSANNTGEIDTFFGALQEEQKQRPHLKNIEGFNLNLGCPSPDVIRFGGGASLMKRTTKVCEIITAMSESTNLPISMKIRLGLNKREMDKGVHLNLLEACNALELKNFNEAIVHLKHGAEKSRTSCHYESIPAIQKVWTKNLTLNGGYSAQFLPKGVYGVMFARAAIADPRTFTKTTTKQNSSLEATASLFHQLIAVHPLRKKYELYLKKHSPLYS